MSITSSNNLAVNNSLTVNGNSIFGSDSTDTVIINGTSTINNGLTISGNINQNSGSFSTGTGGVNLNGDVVISSTKKLTTGTGLTTINGILQTNNHIYVATNKSIYITDSTFTNYLRLINSGVSSYFDYTGGLNFRNSGSTTSFSLNNSNNQATFYYNLNTTGITNTGSSSLGSISCSSLSNSGSSTLAGVSCTSLNNSGSYNAISCTSINNSGSSTLGSISCSSLSNSGSSTLAGISCTSLNNSGSYNAISCTSINNSGSTSLASLSCTSFSNSGTFTQNSTANINSALNVTGLPFFDGTSNQALPTTNSGGSAGLKVYWNATNTGHGETNFLNMSQGGDGGFSWHTSSSSGSQRKIMYLDAAGSLSSIKDITMTGNCTVGSSLTVNGNLTASSISNTGGNSLSYTTLPTLTSSMVGYQIPNLYLSENTWYIPGWGSGSFTLPIGYWLITNNISFNPPASGISWTFGVGTGASSTLPKYSLNDVTTSTNTVNKTQTNYFACSTQGTYYINLYFSGSANMYINYATITIIRIA